VSEVILITAKTTVDAQYHQLVAYSKLAHLLMFQRAKGVQEWADYNWWEIVDKKQKKTYLAAASATPEISYFAMTGDVELGGNTSVSSYFSVHLKSCF
jgi:hypothetical protein